MTHTPTLPNGFSRDFSEAPRTGEFLAYCIGFDGSVVSAIAWWVGGDDFDSDAGWLGTGKGESRPLCWCPIPTPGDAVLKELAGRGK